MRAIGEIAGEDHNARHAAGRGLKSPSVTAWPPHGDQSSESATTGGCRVRAPVSRRAHRPSGREQGPVDEQTSRLRLIFEQSGGRSGVVGVGLRPTDG